MWIAGDAAAQAQCHSSVGDLDLESLDPQQGRPMCSSELAPEPSLSDGSGASSELAPEPSLSDSHCSRSCFQKDECF